MVLVFTKYNFRITDGDNISYETSQNPIYNQGISDSEANNICDKSKIFIKNNYHIEIGDYVYHINRDNLYLSSDKLYEVIGIKHNLANNEVKVSIIDDFNYNELVDINDVVSIIGRRNNNILDILK